MTDIFVYGTLKMGHGNHRLLIGQEYLGQRTLYGWGMSSLGGFPAIDSMPGAYVKGEVYRVDDETLARLDMLEGYTPGGEHNMYEREDVEDVQLYRMPGCLDQYPRVYEGVW